tara:strand:- start:4827 stop:5741 length:915 start_codon:yes stop_codon:yes gene_type:complete
MFKQANQSSPCAIIVSFEPDIAVLLALVEQIGAQADFILVDNASSNGSDFIAHVQAAPRCLGVHSLVRNVGLAAAMNIGLDEATAAGYGFAVLFDQDSQVPVSFFADMQASYREATLVCSAPVAAVGPRIVSPRNSKAMPFKLFSRVFKRSDVKIPGSTQLFYAEFLISSGCLIDLGHLSSIGPMRESYFIDNIDLEWCFRAIAKGYVIVGSGSVELEHSIGVEDDSAWVKAGLIVSHSPLRSYYSTRNRFALYRESYAPLGWKLRDFPRFLLKTLWLLVFTSRRAEYLGNIRRGFADAARLHK